MTSRYSPCYDQPAAAALRYSPRRTHFYGTERTGRVATKRGQGGAGKKEGNSARIIDIRCVTVFLINSGTLFIIFLGSP